MEQLGSLEDREEETPVQDDGGVAWFIPPGRPRAASNGTPAATRLVAASVL